MSTKSTAGASTLFERLVKRLFIDVFAHFRWSFVPPLLVYLAAGLSGITGIVGAFFVKEYLNLSAAYLAGLTFWAGLPWAFKIPLGHLVDLIWRWKSILVIIGAALIASSILMMLLTLLEPDLMGSFMPLEYWFITSTILSPCGYVLQDSVADAMSVEAVPKRDANGVEFSEQVQKDLHTTMQTLGRAILMCGLISVSAINIYLFSGIELLSQPQKSEVYANFYRLALIIPLISVSGVIIHSIQARIRTRKTKRLPPEIANGANGENRPDGQTKINYRYLYGGAGFALLALGVGLGAPRYSQEIVFTGSMLIVLFLMKELLKNIAAEKARMIVATAIIIFVFRAMPTAGPGLTWFEIDRLGFDASFISQLGLIASVLTLVGMLVLRPLIASRSIANIVVILSLLSALLSLPNIGLYYGIHEWTEPLTNGVVDARFIAIIDTAAESPFGQIAMIPMLAWIAQNAPGELKATFFAVMASFTNLALSCGSLLSKYLNKLFVVTREVRDHQSGAIVIGEDYAQLGDLLICVSVLGLALPLLTVWLVNHYMLGTQTPPESDSRSNDKQPQTRPNSP